MSTDRFTDDLAHLIHAARNRIDLLDDGKRHVDAYAERIQALTASLDHAEACQQELFGCLARLLRVPEYGHQPAVNGHDPHNVSIAQSYRQ